MDSLCLLVRLLCQWVVALFFFFEEEKAKMRVAKMFFK